MDQQPCRSEKQHRPQLGAKQRFVPSPGLYGAVAVFPLRFILGAVPFRWPVGLAGFYAVIVRLFQNSDRASTWLVFGLVWMVCATAALASAYLVLCVAETRKRIFARQFARQIDPRASRQV
jgi:hypothetical protein